MDLYARVNILGGHAVRLPKGDVEEAITLDASPLARAMGWIEKGADRLHIVDLDAAAYSDDKNRPLVDELIAAVDVQVQVAGGVRTEAEAVRLIDAGAWRVVMGTAALVDQNLTWDLCRMNPGRIAISLDALPDGELVIRGWKENSGR
ncbi:MAG: HisA/HisF-related TIM barrel protein, partial [Acidimicrobiia bacterium]|nr:HisA/HisF-related TIM barrel protein [Acidimicrobiia bacterium]